MEMTDWKDYRMKHMQGICGGVCEKSVKEDRTARRQKIYYY
jgi:hypothetical protein